MPVSKRSSNRSPWRKEKAQSQIKRIAITG
jgi:hypothetical protein